MDAGRKKPPATGAVPPRRIAALAKRPVSTAIIAFVGRMPCSGNGILSVINSVYYSSKTTFLRMAKA